MKNFVFYFCMLVCIPVAFATVVTASFIGIYQPSAVLSYDSTSADDCSFPIDNRNEDKTKLTFSKTKLIPTEFPGEDIGYGKKSLIRPAITITFEKNLFGDKDTCPVPFNDIDLTKQTEVLKNFIDSSKIYDEFWIFLDNKQAIIVPLTGQKDCSEQLSTLLHSIQEMYKVELEEIPGK